MSNIKKSITAFFILATAFVVLLGLVELGARTYLFSITNHDTDAFIYGQQESTLYFKNLLSASFEKKTTETDVALGVTHQDWDADGNDISSLPLTTFEKKCGGMVHFSRYGHEIIARELLQADVFQTILNQFTASGTPLTAWAFGGSTTAGYNYSKDASSWPEELEKLAPKALHMVNYGANGFSSDQSLDKLRNKLREEPAPDIILWANWINEIDVLFFTMDKNFAQLCAIFPELNQPDLIKKIWRSNAKKYFFRSLAMSLEQNLALFRIIQEAAKKLLSARIPPSMPDKTISNLGQLFEDHGIAVTIENYLINFRELMQLSTKYGFKVVVIRLPVSWRKALWENEVRDFRWNWASAFNKATAKEFAKYDVPLIDLHEILHQRGYFSLKEAP